MKASGRNTPCPVCGRAKDADCRWSDITILCHTGTDLRPGETLTIAGQKWAFIHHNGGFSGVAAVFKPHQERTKGTHKVGTPSTPQELLSRQTKRNQWASLIQEFHDAFQVAWDVPDFYSCTPQQLTKAFAAISNAQECAAGLKPHLRTIWRDHQDLEQLHRLRVEQQLKSIAYMAEDMRQFKQNELGTPCPAAIRDLVEGL